MSPSPRWKRTPQARSVRRKLCQCTLLKALAKSERENVVSSRSQLRSTASHRRFLIAFARIFPSMMQCRACCYILTELLSLVSWWWCLGSSLQIFSSVSISERMLPSCGHSVGHERFSTHWDSLCRVQEDITLNNYSKDPIACWTSYLNAVDI